MRNSLPPFALVTVSLALVHLLSPLALSQESNPRANHETVTSRRYAPPEAIHRHSSTAYEGARRGEAAWITAAGEYLNDEAQAAILWQQVESLHYENELKKTASALTRKKMLNDFRDYERQRRFERKEQSKQLWQEKYQELARTYRLNEYQFNWETGAIYWPALVANPRYVRERERLEILLDRVVRYGESHSHYDRDEIVKVCNLFRNRLREDFSEVPPTARSEYAAMQRFLLGLKYAPLLLQGEAHPQALAMR